MGSKQKGSGEGGRDENCRRRSARKATKHRHVGQRNRRVDGKGNSPRRKCGTRVLRRPSRSGGGGLGSHRVAAVVFGVAGRAANHGSGPSSGADPGGRAPETETCTPGRTPSF